MSKRSDDLDLNLMARSIVERAIGEPLMPRVKITLVSVKPGPTDLCIVALQAASQDITADFAVTVPRYVYHRYKGLKQREKTQAELEGSAKLAVQMFVRRLFEANAAPKSQNS